MVIWALLLFISVAVFIYWLFTRNPKVQQPTKDLIPPGESKIKEEEDGRHPSGNESSSEGEKGTSQGDRSQAMGEKQPEAPEPTEPPEPQETERVLPKPANVDKKPKGPDKKMGRPPSTQPPQTLEPKEAPEPKGTERVPPKPANVNKKPTEPDKRGGRPRGPNLPKEKPHRDQPSPLRAEVVCWKSERTWKVGVEVPEESLKNNGLEVFQNGSPLPRDESNEECWCLQQIDGEVTVRYNEGEAQEAKLVVGSNGYLLFKLSGKNLDKGRLVKSPSSGTYLMIVPNDWKRNEELSGSPYQEPEAVLFQGYLAHFFYLEKQDDKIAFDLSDGKSREIKRQNLRFALEGNRIEDANEYMGPLFGEKPPRVCDLDGGAWENVQTIVVGEEGEGRGKWKKSFTPDPGQKELELPSEVADRESGWYFLRFYDNNDELIESLDFRFICSLKQIKIPEPCPLPAEGGHRYVNVKFIHEPGCQIQLENSANIQINSQRDETSALIPADPNCDQSDWSVCSREGKGSPVKVVILVERVWWAIGEENNPPSEWQDRPIVLSRGDFNATSNKALWLRLPKRHWVDRVRVGFEQSKARPYRVSVYEKTVVVPIREFGDTIELEVQSKEHKLKLWVKNIESVLAILPVSPGPVFPPKLWKGVARKKNVLAKAVMQVGSAKVKINGQPIDVYFSKTPRKARRFLDRLLDFGAVPEILSHMEVNVTVEGSNPATVRQPKAVAHALARVLMDYNLQLRPVLRREGFGGVKVKLSKLNRRGKR